jgi:sugar/nucleoside kinase (ribokinase family)
VTRIDWGAKDQGTGSMAATGIFVGLVTLDMIYGTSTPLNANEKRVANSVVLAAGGPATNAAVTCQHLGTSAHLCAALGCHPLSTVIRQDLTQQQVTLHDLMPALTDPPPFSSIVVTTESGDRAVISRNAVGRTPVEPVMPEAILNQADILLVDGHQMAVGQRVAHQLRQRDVPVVVDAGSWKPGFETLLPLATVVIAAQGFRPPGCQSIPDAIAYLAALGIPHIAVTQGAAPILMAQAGEIIPLTVPPCPVVDTLGAGDIFHGAFCHYFLVHGFQAALTLAIPIAAQACQSFGTRAWLASTSPNRLH